MAKALQRILRFRQLAEEQARLEVERAVQSLRRVSAACEQQVTQEHRQRSMLVESWDPEAPRGAMQQNSGKPNRGSKSIDTEQAENTWLMEAAALEFFSLQRARLEQFREAESRRVEPMIESYKERRRELRQTEQLLAQQAAVEAMEKDRRAQAATDEWFLQRNLAIRRGERKP